LSNQYCRPGGSQIAKTIQGKITGRQKKTAKPAKPKKPTKHAKQATYPLRKKPEVETTKQTNKQTNKHTRPKE